MEKNVVVGAKVPVSVKEALTRLASAKNQTLSDLLRGLISEAIKAG